MINKVFLNGNVTGDVEVKKTPKGKFLATFGVAYNEAVKQEDGTFVSRPHFFEITAWGRQAELCAEHIGKGSPVTIQGTLRQQRWEKEDGSKMSKVVIWAESVVFPKAPRNRDDNSDDDGGGGRSYRLNGRNGGSGRKEFAGSRANGAGANHDEDDDIPF